MHLPTFYLLVPLVEIGRKHLLSDKQFWLKAWGGGFQLQLCCLDLEVSFLFVSSAAALILLSPGVGWGGASQGSVGPGTRQLIEVC